MKILHICLFTSFTENMGYQENMLVDAHVNDGNEVTVISDCTRFEDGVIKETSLEDKKMKNGARLIRRPLKNFYLEIITRNIGKIDGLSNLLQEIAPDIIIHHAVKGIEMLNVADYVKKNPKVKLYLDNHADYHNCWFLSRIVAQRMLNAFLFKVISKYVEKVFYISLETGDFAERELRVPREKLEFLPLGGLPIDESEKRNIRTEIRSDYDVPEDKIVFIHTGKYNIDKKTQDIITAFSEISNDDIILILVGFFEIPASPEIEKIIYDDKRIIFLGWKSLEDLRKILIASDCYLQPGTQSATLQLAISCGLAIIVYPYASHQPYLCGNGYYVKDWQTLKDKIAYLGKHPNELNEMGRASMFIARDILDYKKLARRFYSF